MCVCVGERKRENYTLTSRADARRISDRSGSASRAPCLQTRAPDAAVSALCAARPGWGCSAAFRHGKVGRQTDRQTDKRTGKNSHRQPYSCSNPPRAPSHPARPFSYYSAAARGPSHRHHHRRCFHPAAFPSHARRHDGQGQETRWRETTASSCSFRWTLVSSQALRDPSCLL